LEDLNFHNVCNVAYNVFRLPLVKGVYSVTAILNCLPYIVIAIFIHGNVTKLCLTDSTYCWDGFSIWRASTGLQESWRFTWQRKDCYFYEKVMIINVYL